MTRAPLCGCPWAHCQLLCFTGCDHGPCLHHWSKPEGLRSRAARWLRTAALRIERDQ